MNRLLPTILVTSLFASAALAGSTVNHFGFAVDDEASMVACIFCHNGKMAKDVSMCTEEKMCVIYAKHVVDVRYPTASSDGRYAPVEEITRKGLRLVEGKIGCATCHSLTSKNQHLLIIAAEQDQICRSCHRV